jgi:hypothetical protein
MGARGTGLTPDPKDPIMAAFLPILATAVWDVVSANNFALVHAVITVISSGSAAA